MFQPFLNAESFKTTLDSWKCSHDELYRKKHIAVGKRCGKTGWGYVRVFVKLCPDGLHAQTHQPTSRLWFLARDIQEYKADVNYRLGDIVRYRNNFAGETVKFARAESLATRATVLRFSLFAFRLFFLHVFPSNGLIYQFWKPDW